MSRQFIVDHYAAPARFIKGRNFYSVAKTCFSVNQAQLNIFKNNMISDIVIGDIVANMMNINVVTDGAIVDTGMVNTTVPHDSPAKFNCSGVVADPDLPRELNAPDVFRNK